jgi:hypothetical protein
MSSSFFENVSVIERALSQNADVATKFATIRPLLSDEAVAREFWKRLGDPTWLPILNKEGYFEHPAEPEVLPKGRIRAHIWPPSRYLRTIAKAAPQDVAAIMSRFSTRNWLVIDDVVEAARAMPASSAAKLVPVIQAAVESESLHTGFSHASELSVSLATAGEVSAALDLANALFTPSFDSGQEEPRRRDEHWYKEGLKMAAPALATAAPMQFPAQISNWLEASIRTKGYVSTETGDDSSYMWRPTLDDGEENREYDFASFMAGQVRAAFQAAMESGGLSLAAALAILNRFKFGVFRRLEVFLIAHYANQDEALAKRYILTRRYLDEYNIRTEYAALLGRCWPLLSNAEQETWYGWVDAGPDVDEQNRAFEAWMGRPPAAQEREDRVNYWRFEKLLWIRDHLSGKRAAFVDQMLKKMGEPQQNRVAVEWGSKSPISINELSGKSLVDALGIVMGWKPKESDGHTGMDIDGLVSTFGQYVAEHPHRHSSDAVALKGVAPHFVRKFIQQMTEAIKKGESVELLTVLSLCDWVVAQPSEFKTKQVFPFGRLIDPDWQWARDEVGRFVEEVCKAKTGQVPTFEGVELQTRMWDLLKQLCEDRPQSNILRDTKTDDPRLVDYLDLGINSSRGRAVAAALEYARWRANHLKVVRDGREIVPGGFGSMAEVRQMLEWQIAPTNRRVETLAVLGSRLGLLYWIDRNWLAAKAEALFDLRGIEREPAVTEGWAAWNAFLVWVPAHIEFYRLFQSQFAYAVDQASRLPTGTEGSQMRPMQHLGEHLMLLYGRGDLGLDDDSGLLRRFVSSAAPELRRYAIGFVGQSIGRTRDVPRAAIERFQTLWDLYWNERGKADAAEKPTAHLFGAWFSSKRFAPDWALSRLRDFVDVAPVPEPDHDVVDTLATMAATDAFVTLQILEKMVGGDAEGWHIDMWSKSVQAMLTLGMKNGGSARALSIEIINLLGRRGHMKFGELLSVPARLPEN